MRVPSRERGGGVFSALELGIAGVSAGLVIAEAHPEVCERDFETDDEEKAGECETSESPLIRRRKMRVRPTATEGTADSHMAARE
jgi:hypothetical protein